MRLTRTLGSSLGLVSSGGRVSAGQEVVLVLSFMFYRTLVRAVLVWLLWGVLLALQHCLAWSKVTWEFYLLSSSLC